MTYFKKLSKKLKLNEMIFIIFFSYFFMEKTHILEKKLINVFTFIHK